MSQSLPVRLRRLRRTPSMRALFTEVSVTPGDLVQPYFIVPGKGQKAETRPGVGLWQLSPDMLREEVQQLAKGGVGGVMLFGVPDHKRDDGKGLDKQLAPLEAAVKEVKATAPELPLFADVCLCAYTSHGHCGLVKDGEIVNDESVRVLSEMAVLLARWGVDFVCPSDMMDGRVRAIRLALDESGLEQTAILSYAIKMASAFYGPFREAAHSAPSFGDRKSYQMPANNRREARRELLADVEEGADALLVKPAMTNLDLLRDAREATDVPLFAYQVSGEYAMMRAAGDAGLIDFERAVDESLVSIKRAGADVIVSYAARAMCRKERGWRVGQAAGTSPVVEEASSAGIAQR
ncbi:MAG: porphobilinogen synthase [Myxococcales bacterium]|nr:porphobilinogen synthase [Myxococcales bacterium]